jgi:hypothetical protein
MSSELEASAMDISQKVIDRTVELVLAPLNHQEMLWIAVPLIIATLFMTMYFARYKKEELGWNTAFGNTMVFLFVALNIIKTMYYQDGVGDLENIYSNSLYLFISIGLVAVSLLLMAFTYLHLLPKRLAFFLFSAAPINVSVYVVMAVVYASLPADYLTVLAGVVFLFVILLVAKILQFFLRIMGLEYKTKLVNMELPEELASKIKEFDTEEERKALAEKVEEVEEELKEKEKKKRKSRS